MKETNKVVLIVTVFCALMVLVIFSEGRKDELYYPTLQVSTLNNSSQLGAVEAAFPNITLPQRSQGQEAIDNLGSRLPEVAAFYKIDQEKLKEKLKKDKTLKVDHTGRLLYVEEEIGTVVADEFGTTEEIVSLDQTFMLHSKPGASKTLVLDFDGHLLTDSVWLQSYSGTSYFAPPMDFDGNPSSFSDAERILIQGVWTRVAEDYAAFDIDVTTQEPSPDRITRTSTSDLYYGNRVLISPSASVLYPNSFAGGVSYVGMFNSTTERYKISLVFPDRLSHNEKSIAEAASHENGHSLGLYHKGLNSGTAYYSGHGNWAPIMGVGYSRPVVQWSKGEYYDANDTVDEIAQVQRYGLTLRSDEAGDTFAQALPLSVTNGTVSYDGYIGRTGDVDVFKISAGNGAANFTVSTSEIEPNLDIEVTLYDSYGTVVSTNNGTGMSASIPSVTLSQGTYYLSVTGVGYGNPLNTGYSNYSSMGEYHIRGNVVAGSVVSQGSAPIAVISATPVYGTSPLAVQFSGSNSYDADGGILSYQWNFGDGSVSTLQNPQHTYSIAGIYTSTLTVTDNTNLSDSDNIQIQVSTPPTPPPPSITTPAAPTNLSATTNRKIKYFVNLKWSDNSTNETGFEIERQIYGSSSWSKVGQSGANTASFSDNVMNGVYNYRVRAIGSNDDFSTYSNIAKVRVNK